MYDANARLIAMAPEMYDAIASAVWCLQNNVSKEEVVEILLHVINKADAA